MRHMLGMVIMNMSESLPFGKDEADTEGKGRE